MERRSSIIWAAVIAASPESESGRERLLPLSLKLESRRCGRRSRFRPLADFLLHGITGLVVRILFAKKKQQRTNRTIVFRISPQSGIRNGLYEITAAHGSIRKPFQQFRIVRLR